MTQTTTQQAPSGQAGPQGLGAATPPPSTGSGLPYGKGDLAYAPALAYAMVAKLMGEELKLSNTLKKIQSDETVDAMNAAADQATQTRDGASADAIGQSISGAFSVAQGAGSIGVESYLSGSQGSSRAKQTALEEKLNDHNSKIGASNTPEALKAHTDTKLKLEQEIREHNDAHNAAEKKKNAFHAAVQSIGMLPQTIGKVSGSIKKSNDDAQASLDQANQQAFNQVANEMSSANQAALSTVSGFTSANFAEATAIRG